MADDLLAVNKRAVELLHSIPLSTTVRVISHYDADGISAAGILCSALYRAGYGFHATLMRNPFNKGLERIAGEDNELIIFSDMGSAQVKTIEEMGCKTIIFDHHQYLETKTKDHVIQINANLCGIDGNYEACGASLCYFFATTLDEQNADLVSFALAGAIGDKQHIGGLSGFNKELGEKAVHAGFLKEKTGIKLYGSTVADALYYAVDPYYAELSGNKTEIATVLQKLRIKPSSTLEKLSSEEMVRLQSYLFYRLLKAGCQQNILDIAIRTRYYSEKLGCTLERFADLLDACGKFGHRGLGLSLCLGDNKVFSEAEAIEKKYKDHVLVELKKLEQDEFSETDSFRYFYSDSSSLGGVVGGIAMNYLFDDRKPLFSLARKEEEIHVSCRGTRSLVERGLDLGGAMNAVAKDIGGFGGGHKIAAGATIAVEKEKEFIEKTDSILRKQMKGNS